LSTGASSSIVTRVGSIPFRRISSSMIAISPGHP
jgi:hypothetical protein